MIDRLEFLRKHFGRTAEECGVVQPDASHLVGLVAVHREPHTPLVSAFLNQARTVYRASQKR